MFTSILLYGGKTDTIEINRKFSVGLTASPNYSFRNLVATDFGKSDNAYTINGSEFDYREHFEDKKLSYSYGINLQYRINKHFALEAAVYRANIGYEIEHVQYGYSNNINHLVYDFNYVDIPLSFKYFVFNKKVSLFFIAGVSANVFVLSRVKTINLVTNDVAYSHSREGVTPYNISVLGGLGISYEISNRMNVSLQPQYERFLNTKLNNDYLSAIYDEYLYSYGVNFGLYYTF
jgi:opacity protein-like surface antigen